MPPTAIASLRRARDLADRHYADPIDLDALASAAGYWFTALVGPKAFQELGDRGGEFIQEPADRPYGVEAILRDNTGNWLVLVERKGY